MTRNSLNRSLVAAGCVLLCLTLAAGCGDDAESARTSTPVIVPGEEPVVAEEESAAPAEQTTAAKPEMAVAPAATDAQPEPEPTAEQSGVSAAGPVFRGRVTVAGAIPSVPPLVEEGQSVRDAICSEKAIPDDSLAVSEDGGLADVFVYLAEVPDGAEVPPVSEEPIVMDQIGCRYIPHAFVCRVGQQIILKNSDPVAHNIHTYPFKNASLNTLVQPEATGGDLVYARPERFPVTTKCDIHPWMLGLHLPLEHPWATVTKADGTFEIAGLPQGDLEFVVWHERSGYINKKVTATIDRPDQVVEQNFEVAADKLLEN